MKDINDQKCVLANVKSTNRKSIQKRREYLAVLVKVKLLLDCLDSKPNKIFIFRNFGYMTKIYGGKREKYKQEKYLETEGVVYKL